MSGLSERNVNHCRNIDLRVCGHSWTLLGTVFTTRTVKNLRGIGKTSVCVKSIGFMFLCHLHIIFREFDSIPLLSPQASVSPCSSVQATKRTKVTRSIVISRPWSRDSSALEFILSRSRSRSRDLMAKADMA